MWSFRMSSDFAELAFIYTHPTAADKTKHPDNRIPHTPLRKFFLLIIFLLQFRDVFLSFKIASKVNDNGILLNADDLQHT